MTKAAPETLIFGISAVAVVLISITLDLRRSALEAAAAQPGFSGSKIVAELPSVLPAARLPSRLRVTVVRDEAAATYYDSPATLDSIIEEWRSELVAIGADVHVVRSGSLPAERTARVLVIPSSPCMTIETREAIEGAAARGQGVIITGLAGAYDAGCRKIGYGLIVGATGAARAETLEPRSMVYVVLPSGSPLSADIPPGARIELSPGGQIALRKQGRDAYYSDYALQPLPAGGTPLLDGAIARSSRNGSRIVYWGFELNSVLPRAWNRSIVRLLVRNSVAWAGRVPFGWVEPWPHGRRAAAAFAQDVEFQFENARFALDSLRAAGVKGTYFVTSKYAAHYKRVTRQLAAEGEIGTHTENHRRLGGAPYDVQRARLRTTQREINRLLGEPVAGLRPPQEQFDSATMAAWLAVGGKYLFGVNDSRVAAPELLSISDDTLVLFSRVVSDDVALADLVAQSDQQNLARIFLNDLAQVRALGGLYLFSYHSQLLARPELVPVLARVARAAAADSSVWLATNGDIAEWWRARAGLRVETRLRTNAVDVLVYNPTADSIAGVVTRVMLPASRRIRSVTTTLLPSDDGIARLALPEIPAFSTQVVTVNLEPIKSPPIVERPRPRPRYIPKKKPPWWQFWKR